MEIRFFFKVIQRGWWMIVISALLAVNFSLMYSYFIARPNYEAVARFIVSPNLQNTDSRDMVNSLEALDKRSIIATYAEVLNSYQITNEALTLLRKNPNDFVDYKTSATLLPDANIIRYSVQGPDPEVAAILANSVGQYAIDYVRKLYVVYNIDFLDKATPPIEPYSPRPFQDAALAMLVGLTIGVALAVFRDQVSGSLARFSQRNVVDYESQALTRVHFERRVREEVSKQPDGVSTLGLIYLNGIQDIYDSLPQIYINQIMRRVSETLKLQLRGNDLVGRWAKLEFGVLLLSTDGAAAMSRLERIRQTLAQPMTLEGAEDITINLDPRIGFSDRQGGEAVSVTMSQAENALDLSLASDAKLNMYKVRPFG